jgi:hypothetical protein
MGLGRGIGLLITISFNNPNFSHEDSICFHLCNMQGLLS